MKLCKYANMEGLAERVTYENLILTCYDDNESSELEELSYFYWSNSSFLGVLSLYHNVAVLLMIRGVLILKFCYLLIPKSNYILSKSTNDRLPI